MFFLFIYFQPSEGTAMDKRVIAQMDHWFAKSLYSTTKEDLTKKYQESLEPEKFKEYFTSMKKGNYGGMISEVFLG